MLKYTLIRQNQSDFVPLDFSTFEQLLNSAQVAPGRLGVALHFGHPGLELAHRPLELLGMLDELLDRLRVRIRMLLHYRVGGEARGFRFLAFDDAARNADHGRADRHFLDHDRVRADARALAHGEAAEDLRASAHHHARTERGMPFGASVERRAAERHALVDRATVAHFCRLADDDTHAVIDENARADLCPRMDLDAGEEAPDVRGEAPKPAQALQPEPAREPVDPDRVQPGIAGEDFPGRARRRVPLEDAGNVAAQFPEHAAILWVPD